MGLQSMKLLQNSFNRNLFQKGSVSVQFIERRKEALSKG
jgi:hypothetical protein